MYRILKSSLLFWSVFTAVSGCSSTDTKIDREFTTSNEEIRAAKSEFRTSKNEILYLLMVDRSGAVVKVKLLGYKKKAIEERIAYRFKSKLYQYEFYPAKSGEPDYREFIYPLNVNSSYDTI